MMFGIGDFLKKFQNSQAREIYARSSVSKAIKKFTGIDVSLDDITFKFGVATLKNVSQISRSAIFIKKQAILKEISLLQDVKKVTDLG